MGRPCPLWAANNSENPLLVMVVGRAADYKGAVLLKAEEDKKPVAAARLAARQRRDKLSRFGQPLGSYLVLLLCFFFLVSRH